MTIGKIKGKYTDNFYDDDGSDRHYDKWDTQDVTFDFWYVRDSTDDPLGNPEGIIISGDIAPYGLIELVLTPETLDAMLRELAEGRTRFK